MKREIASYVFICHCGNARLEAPADACDLKTWIEVCERFHRQCCRYKAPSAFERDHQPKIDFGSYPIEKLP